MADTVIRSFLVGLGFKIDEPGLRKFNEQIVKTHHAVRDFSLAFAGFAVGIEEAIRRTARQFENLFYLSQQTGISVKNLQTLGFAFGQVGLSADQMKQTVASFTSALMDNPGLRAFVNIYAPGFKDAEGALRGVAARYKEILEQSGPMSAAASQFRDAIRAMRLDPDMLLRLAQNFEDLTKWQQRLADAIAKIGLNSDDVAKKARDAMNEWRFTWAITDKAFERIIGDTFPAFRRLLEDFNTWLLKGETVKAFNDIADSIHNWLQDGKNIEKVENALTLVGKAAYYVSYGIVKIIEGFVWLSEKTDPITATVIAFFTIIAGRAAIAAGAVWLLNTALLATGRAFGFGRGVLGLLGTGGVGAAGAAGAVGNGGLLAILGGLLSGGLAAGAAGLFLPDSQMGPKAQEARKGAIQGTANSLNDFLHWLGRVTGYEDEQGRSTTGTPDTVEGAPKAPVPGARKSSFGAEGGGGVSISEALFSMFGSWFQGDTAFRPIVVIADEYYTKLVDALRNMTGIGSGGGGTGPGGTDVTRTPGRGYGIRGHGGGAGGGARSEYLGQGKLVPQIIAAGREAGATDEVIKGLIATAIGEGGLEETWKVGDVSKGGSFGPWQFFTHGELPAYLSAGGKPGDVPGMVKYIVNRMNKSVPGFSQIKDPRRVVQLMHDVFRDYGAKVGNLPAAESIFNRHQGTTSSTASDGAKWRTREEIERGVKPGQGAGGRISSLDAAIGDSIAVGLASAAGVPSDAIGGTTPKQIYDRVMKHVKDYAGKTVALGSGSNDPNQLEYVHNTMKELHKVGAKVVLLGVGSGIRNYMKVNKQLGEYAHEFGDPFTGELEGTEGGRVHPRSYRSTLGQVHKALGTEGRHSSRTNNIDSEHNTTINVHGSTDPHGTARAVADLQDRRSMLHARNLRTSIA